MKPSAVILLVLFAVTALVLALVNQDGSAPVDDIAGGPVQMDQNEDNSGEMALPDLNTSRVAATIPDGSGVTVSPDSGDEMAPFENELVGSVRNESGGPIPGATVILSPRPLQAMVFVNDPVDTSGDIPTITRSDGSFRFIRIEPNENYTFIVDHPDYSRKEIGNVRVGVSGTFEEPPITLTTGAMLSGLISDTGGNPVPGAVVHLDGMLRGLGNKPSPDRMTTKSNGIGRYEFRSCPTGRCTLTVSSDGYGRILVSGVKITGTKDVVRDVTLEVAEMICGRVINSDNVPIMGADVIALSYSTGNTQCRDFIQTDSDGQFCLERLNPGQYTIAVSAKGYRPERAQRVATSSANLVLELSPQASVSGRVISKATGEPLVTFTCVLRIAYENTDVTSATETRQDFRHPLGEYLLTDGDPGTYVVQALSQGFAASSSQRFTISQGQSLSGVVVEVGKGGTLKGRVVDSESAPIKGALVSTHDNTWTDDAFTRALGDLFPTNATAKKARTNKDGRFKISGLSPENYQIRIQAQGRSRLVKTNVLVSENRVNDLGTMRLVPGGGVSGLVVDQAGQPVVSARVTLRVDGRPITVFEPRETKSSNKGRYTFVNVPAGNYKIMAMRSNPNNDVFGGLVDQQRSEKRVTIREGQEAKIDMRIGG